MSYILANTSNPLGRRGLGWDNAPYPVYKLSRSVARLNGDISPAGTAAGAITYRIDPRTGQYQFYRTDIKPRGVFMQNTFQHPAPATMSALGMRVLPIGKSVSGSTLQRGSTSRGPMIALRPGVTLSGLGCGSCGGRCNSLDGPRFARLRGLRGLGDPCGPQPDGTIVPCPPDPSMATEQGDVPLPGVTPTVVAPAPGTTLETIDLANRNVSPITFSFGGSVPPSFSVGAPPKTQGTAISNNVLIIGGVLMAALVLEGSKGRRR